MKVEAGESLKESKSWSDSRWEGAAAALEDRKGKGIRGGVEVQNGSGRERRSRRRRRRRRRPRWWKTKGNQEGVRILKDCRTLAKGKGKLARAERP